MTVLPSLRGLDSIRIVRAERVAGKTESLSELLPFDEDIKPLWFHQMNRCLSTVGHSAKWAIEVTCLPSLSSRCLSENSQARAREFEFCFCRWNLYGESCAGLLIIWRKRQSECHKESTCHLTSKNTSNTSRQMVAQSLSS